MRHPWSCGQPRSLLTHGSMKLMSRLSHEMSFLYLRISQFNDLDVIHVRLGPFKQTPGPPEGIADIGCALILRQDIEPFSRLDDHFPVVPFAKMAYPGAVDGAEPAIFATEAQYFFDGFPGQRLAWLWGKCFELLHVFRRTLSFHPNILY